jgi:hypothetical protein
MTARFRRHTGIGYRFVEEEKDRKIIVNFTLNIKKMAKSYSSKAAAEAQAAELKATAVLEANEVAQAAAEAQATTQDALEMEVFEDAPGSGHSCSRRRN